MFIILSKMGYYFSDNIHTDKSGIWGFIRLNYEKNNVKEYAIIDIDFQENKYSHIHTNKTIFRIDQ
jgi:hypothetical protein